MKRNRNVGAIIHVVKQTLTRLAAASKHSIPYIFLKPSYFLSWTILCWQKPDDGVYPRKIRVSQGNGLRPEIWREFQERFQVGKIFEIYAATEGNFGFINIDGKVGTVGRYPWFMKVLI